MHDGPMNPLRLVARELGKYPWFSAVGRRIVPVDVALQRRTRGRLSVLRLAGIPSLLLTTTGRRSGQRRSVPLLYVPHGEEYVVVGSNWGGPRHPAWVHNLWAHPDAVIELRGATTQVHARVVTGTERDWLWRTAITPTWPGYDGYVARAGSREISVFALRPK